MKIKLPWLKLLAGLKIAVVALLFLHFSDEFFIGDVPVSAQGEAPENAVEPASEANGASDNVVEQPKPNTEVAQNTKKRKGFMDDLLDLPEINPDAIQKEDLGNYLSLAERKRVQVEGRIRILGEREEQLLKLEKSIEKKIKLLEDERKFFAQTIQNEKKIQGDRLEEIVTFYGKMEPKKAGPILENMDKDLVVSLFKNIKPKQVKLYLEAMNPERSRFFTEYYGRIRSAKEYDLLKELNRSLLNEFEECKGVPKGAAH